MSKNRVTFPSELIIRDGKVGIGTSSPSSTFNVLGSAEVTGELKVTSVGSTAGEHIRIEHYRDNGGSIVYQTDDRHLFSIAEEGTFAYVISDDDGRSILDITKAGITSIRESLSVGKNISVGTTVTVGSGLTISENSFLRSLQATDVKFLSTGSSEATRITAKHYSNNLGSLVIQGENSHLFSVDNEPDIYYSINDSEARATLTVSSSGITTIRDLFQNRVNFTSVGATSGEQIRINHYRNIAYQPAVGSTSDNKGAISFDSPSGISTNGITYFPASLFALTNGGGNIFSVSGYNWFSGSPGVPAIDVTQNSRVGLGTTNPSIDIDIARETYFTGSNTVFRNKAQIQDSLILSETLSPSGISTTSIVIEPLTQGVTTYVPARSATLFRGELDQSLNGGQLFTILNNNSSLVTINRFVGLSSVTPAPTGQRNIETVVEIGGNGNVGVGTTNPSARFNVVGNSVFSGITTLGLTSTTSPSQNSTMSFELTNNNTLTVRVRGTDGVVRTGIVTLA